MIRIAAAARRALARLTRAPGRQPAPATAHSHRETADGAVAWFRKLHADPPTLTLPARQQVMPQARTASAPPWNPAAGWAGDCAPDPETARLVWEAERDFRATFVTEEDQPCASGNGPVTVAAPLAPLPPEPKPEPLPAAAPAPAATTGHRPTTTIGSAQSPTSDALTLLDERQQLIDHAKKLIAAAKFDRIFGGVMADA